MPRLRRDHHPRPARADDAMPYWRRALPGLAVLLDYRRAWLRGDLLAGVTVAAYLVPQVMAYAEVAGLPAVTGLWAIVGPLLLYAFVGSSRQLSVGPESTTALMTFSALGAVAGTVGTPRYAQLAAVTAVTVAGVCLLGWLARVGFLADLLSKPVLVGYMSGIAVLMIVSQLGKITGMRVPGENTLDKLGYVLTHLGAVHRPTLVLGAAMLVTLLTARRWAPTWPAPLLAMLLAAAAVAVLGLADRGVEIIGEVPRGLPVPGWPDWSGVDLKQLIPVALGLALVGYSDNVLTARALAESAPAAEGPSGARQQVDSDQEFLALGAANLASGLMQGFPVSSSASRSVIGVSMGATTQAYSLVALIAVVASVYFLGPVLAAFPSAALGAMVVYAAGRLVDIAELRRILRFRISEFVLALITAGAVVAFDVLVGIGVAVGLSLLDVLRRIADPHDGVLGYVPGVAGMHDIEDYADAQQVPGLVVYRYDSPLFFANAENFRRRALSAVSDAEASGRVDWVLLNAEANIEIDLTAVDVLDALRQTLADRGIVLAFARVKQDVREQLDAAGFLDRLGRERFFMTLPTAVAAYNQWHQEAYGRPPVSE